MTSLISKGSPRGARKLHAHEAVAAQATELCLSAYEALMEENSIWEAWRASHPGFTRRHLELAFVKTFLFRFIPSARAMMAARLQAPLDDATKDAIYEALLLDGTLLRGRGRAPTVIQPKG
jgi:hypothetical protein